MEKWSNVRFRYTNKNQEICNKSYFQNFAKLGKNGIFNWPLRKKRYTIERSNFQELHFFSYFYQKIGNDNTTFIFDFQNLGCHKVGTTIYLHALLAQKLVGEFLITGLSSQFSSPPKLQRVRTYTRLPQSRLGCPNLD